jgi:hypothetical protein
VVLGLEFRAFTLSHSTRPLLWWVFRVRISWTIAQDWLQTLILLMSASWLARIVDVSHWCLATLVILEVGSHELFAQAGLRPALC